MVSYLDTDFLDDRLLGVSGLSSLLSMRLPDNGLEDELAAVAKRLKKKSSLSSAVFSSAGAEAAVLS